MTDSNAQVFDALELSAEVVEETAEKLERRGGALREWFETYGVEVEDEPDDTPEFKIGRENGREIKEILRDGLRAWTRAGRERSRFMCAEVRYWNDEFGAHHYTKARCALGEHRSVRNRV